MTKYALNALSDRGIVDPRHDPSNRFEHDFPILKDAIPQLVNGRYSKKRRSGIFIEDSDIPGGLVPPAAQGRAEIPPRVSWRDLLSKDYSHVDMDVEEMNEGEFEDDLLVNFDKPVRI
ncbi:OLC1v1036487C1 [Oldenlandia corymbosa var. corymbosa]|uniref:OLC1v1036487C1 n=1 Tax=Oldenlandia corymbosa var. corymbosa TaxID=529605 RepID=A0AAV1CW41_OLDCO|nr:OLC1v1036487C1 [Oldenlandia corymbosa var. corymbosa]